MNFKKLFNLRISTEESGVEGKWKILEREGREIILFIIFVNHRIDKILWRDESGENWIQKTIDDRAICDWIMETFLGEYICCCVLRGNPYEERKCINRDPTDCTPFKIVDRILGLLWDLPFKDSNGKLRKN